MQVKENLQRVSATNMQNFTIHELLLSLTNSHFAAGAAGGLVRSFYVREAFGIAFMRTIAGGVSAHYVTPILLWAAPRFLDISQVELVAFTSPAGAAASFAVGLMGIFLSTTIEKIINKRFEIDDKT